MELLINVRNAKMDLFLKKKVSYVWAKFDLILKLEHVLIDTFTDKKNNKGMKTCAFHIPS